MIDTNDNNDLLKTINSLNLGVVVVDKELKVELINEGFNKLWKTSADDFTLGDPFRKLIDINRDNGIYAVEDEKWEEYIDTRLNEISEGDVEPRELVRADNTHLIYSVTNLSQGRRLISYFDITAQKKHEKELEEARNSTKQYQARLTEAIDSLEDGFVIYDEKDKLVACNDAFGNQFGEGKKFLKTGHTFYDMTSKLIKSGIIPIEKGKEREFLDNLMLQRCSEEGIEKTFQTHERQRDKRSKSGDLVGIRTDITELKAREEELEDLSKLLQDTTDAMVQGMAVFENGILKFFNPTLIKLLDLKKTNLKIGMSYERFLTVLKDTGHYGRGKAAEKTFKENLASLHANTQRKLERQGLNGKFFQVDVIPQKGKRLTLSYTDITDSMEARKQLEERKALVDSILRASENAVIVTKGFNELITYNDRALK